MSIVRVTQKTPRTGTFNDTGVYKVVTIGGVTTYTALPNATASQTFEVLSDDRYDGAWAVYNADNLPKLGATYMENGVLVGGLTCSSVKPTFKGVFGNYFAWEVVCDYGGNRSQGASQPQDNELLNFNYSVELVDYYNPCDYYGHPNTNTFGEFFDEPINNPNGCMTLTYQMKSQYNPLPLARDYFNSVNGTMMWGWAEPYTVKVESITGSCSVKQSTTEWTNTFVLKVMGGGWYLPKANSSHFYLDANGQLQRALNADGSPTDEPVLINKDGTLYNPKSIYDAPYYIQFEPYRMCDLNELYLPDPYSL